MRGSAAHQLGDFAGAASSFATAMVDDPGVVRRLGVALPVRIEVGTDSLASAVARRLAGSPRFDVRDNARLRLTVEASDSGGVEACLHTEAGARITCVRSADGSGSGTTDAPVVQTDARPDTGTVTRGTEPDVIACAEIHDALFAAPLQLETIDRSSLDGRTTVDEAAARDALRDALDAAMQER